MEVRRSRGWKQTWLKTLLMSKNPLHLRSPFPWGYRPAGTPAPAFRSPRHCHACAVGLAQAQWWRVGQGRPAPPCLCRHCQADAGGPADLPPAGQGLFPALGSDALSGSRSPLLSTNSSAFHISPRADRPACSIRWFVYGYHGDASLPRKGSAREGGREGEVRMLRRWALTWTDGGAGFARSERAAVRAGGEVSPAADSPGTPPAVVLSSVSR